MCSGSVVTRMSLLAMVDLERLGDNCVFGNQFIKHQRNVWYVGVFKQSSEFPLSLYNATASHHT
jgi:hypothetical protein